MSPLAPLTVAAGAVQVGAGAPTAAELADPKTAKTWQTAQDFEGMALGQMLAPMFATVDTSKGLFGGGDGEAAWQPMLVQEMAKSIASHGGLGLAVPVFRQMLQMQETQP
jgi:Rod binding domain-containing protein